MPFKSKKQWRKCMAMRSRGEAGSWDCGEWADATKSYKKLPEKVAAVRDVCACLYKLSESLPSQAVVRKHRIAKVAEALLSGQGLVTAIRSQYPGLTEKAAQDAAQAVCRRVVALRKQSQCEQSSIPTAAPGDRLGMPRPKALRRVPKAPMSTTSSPGAAVIH